MPIRSVVKRHPFNKKQALPRMAWSPENLFNVWLRTSPESYLHRETEFNTTQKTLFQQRWLAKRLTKGYHGDHIMEKKFKRWFLPESIPTIRHNSGGEAAKSVAAKNDMAKWVEGKARAGGRTDAEKKAAALAKDAISPVGTLMYGEVERRIDVVIFRACLAQSVWQARSYVTHGHVKLNGKPVTNANTLLEPGDLFTINPEVVPFIQRPKAAEVEAAEQVEEAEEAEAVEEAEAEVAAEKKEGEAAEAGAEVAAEKEGEVEDAESAEAEAEVEAAEPEAHVSKPKPKPKSYTPPNVTEDVVGGTYFKLPDYAQPSIFVPAYILPSFLTCSGVYVRHPTARPAYSEIPSPYDASGPLMSMSWEWYSRVAPKMTPRRRARLMDPQRSQDRK
ncbi:37S ribosomal protein S4-like, mitochondrial [Vanrija pseudolonga]|uniref:37S ribosomal protein S4-like, mitochondrial n=1 Tax=Vanrija pseudolonga TaxID=143232 RepID=A0AAF1BIA7_9TREE|nr:37S ribosomal protein S4-like, mitochondrial [Vanrija pseudolonga]